jgi:uncharacterized membrane protein
MDTPYHLSVKTLLGAAWQHFKMRPWFFVSITIFCMFLSVLFDATGERLHTLSPVVEFFFSLAAFFIETALLAGYFLILKQSLSGKNPVFRDLFNGGEHIWPFIGAVLLSSCITILGFIAFIIPGFIALSAFYFTSYIVLDKNMKPVAALKESMRMTQGNKLQILRFIFVICLLNLVGALLFGVGLFVTYPISLIAYVILYKELSLKMNQKQEEGSEASQSLSV